MDSHAQRGLDEQRALCAVEHARVEAERRSAAPLVAARNTVDAFDVIQRVGRRARTWRPLGQFYGCMGAAFEVKPRGEHGPLLVLKVVLNDPTHGGAARSEADVLEKFRAEIEFTGDPGRLPPHRNLAYCYRYFVAAARGLPDLDWMDEYTECQTLCVVMEHINGTTLQTLAGQQQQQQHAAGGGAAGGGAASLFPEAVLLSYSEQLLRAIAHLKDHAIVHRDIKPDNVMVSGAFRQFLKVRATRATAAAWPETDRYRLDRHKHRQPDSQADTQINRQIEVQKYRQSLIAAMRGWTHTIVFHRWHISVCVQLIDFGCAISVRESGAENAASHFLSNCSSRLSRACLGKSSSSEIKRETEAVWPCYMSCLSQGCASHSPPAATKAVLSST